MVLLYPIKNILGQDSEEFDKDVKEIDNNHENGKKKTDRNTKTDNSIVLFIPGSNKYLPVGRLILKN